MNDIFSIGNDVEFSVKHKGVFERSFSKKDLGEAAYILALVRICAVQTVLSPFHDGIWNRRLVSDGDRGVLPT